MSGWPRPCGCGRTFSAHEWALLACIGNMVDDFDAIELRNCPCGSTISAPFAILDTIPPAAE